MQKDAEMPPHSTPISQEALSLTDPYRSQRMAASLKSVLDFYGDTQSQYWWQQSLVHSIASPTCHQVQHRQ